MKKPLSQALLFAAFLCLGLMAAGLATRPIFPVDETRYLTVAWEMFQSGNWVLPTLNGEAYHHKPPVLFWMINLIWSVFGVSQTGAMVVPFLGAFAVLGLSARLATRLFPDTPNAPLLTVAVLGGGLPFVIYSNLIMFDLLLTVFVLLGVTAIWDFLKTRENKHIGLLALAVGLGLLTKGPAVLLHMAPALLCVRYWMGTSLPPLKSWLPKIILGLVMGIAIALCWAIPAAIEGGKEFTEKIFYGQTTGRMVNAFDHQRPVFWYLMFVPLFVMPWVFSPALWRSLKAFLTDKTTTENKRFLLTWIGIVFVAFSFISGKQVHYLLPLLPPIAFLIVASVIKLQSGFRKRDILPVLAGANILTIIPVALHFFAVPIGNQFPNSVHMVEAFQNLNIIPSLIMGVSILAIGFSVKYDDKTKSLMAVAVAMVLLMTGFQGAAQSGAYKNYDLSSFGAEMQKYPDRPKVFVNNYQGQFGFLARLQKPMDVVVESELPKWIKGHPDGLIVLYTRTPEKYAEYHLLYTSPFRLTNHLMLLEAKGQPVANGGN